MPLPGDYDGDGIDDIAVFRRDTGIWYLSQSGAGYKTLQWGAGLTDYPTPGNFVTAVPGLELHLPADPRALVCAHRQRVLHREPGRAGGGYPRAAAEVRRMMMRLLTPRPLLLATALVTLLLPASTAAQETIEYYGTDHLGSVRVVFDVNGTLLGRTDYLPYGEELATEGPVPAEKFTGQARDAEAGQDYFHARMYQPRTGRFNAVDPVFNALGAPQKWNRYAYALSNPLSFVDPTGEDCRTTRPPPTPAGNPGPNFSLGVQCDLPVAPSSLAETIGLALATIATSSGPTGYQGPNWTSILAARTAPGVVATDLINLFSSDSTTGQRVLAAASVAMLANPIPLRLARVIPIGVEAKTLGRSGTPDVFVTAADDIAGMTGAQIAARLGIPESPGGFRVIEFSPPTSGLASPIFRTDPNFVGGGRTIGGAREFVIPNQSIPNGAIIRTVPW